MTSILLDEIILLCFDNILEVRLLSNHFKSLITTGLLAEHIERFGHNKHRFLLFTDAITKYSVNKLHKHESNTIRLMAWNVYSLCNYTSYKVNINSAIKYFQYIYEHFNNNIICNGGWGGKGSCNNKTLFPNDVCREDLTYSNYSSLRLKGYDNLQLREHSFLVVDDIMKDYHVEFSIDGKIINIKNIDQEIIKQLKSF